jgi:hypothetical protein
MAETDADRFHIAQVSIPGTFEDVIDLLIPDVWRRGIYPQDTSNELAVTEKGHGHK